jgi:hypothetical protein
MPSDMDNLYEQFKSEFDALIEHRRVMGAEEYGQWGFLDNDTFQMMYEELADAVNYALFTFIKLRLVERAKDEVRGNRTAVYDEPDERL